MQMQPGLQESFGAYRVQCGLKHQHIACGCYVPHRIQYLRHSLGSFNYYLGLRATVRNIQLVLTVINPLIFFSPAVILWLFYMQFI